MRKKPTKAPILTPRGRRRFAVLVVAGGILSLSAGLVLVALEEAVVYFYSPGDVRQKSVPAGARIRLGGLVQEGSVVRGPGAETVFAVTDLQETMTVRYEGVLPDLFREGQGVIAEGVLDGNHVLQAETVLARHDETYMPPEVADALQRRGYWQDKP